MNKNLPISDDDYDPTHQMLIEDIQKNNRKAKAKAAKAELKAKKKKT